MGGSLGVSEAHLYAEQAGARARASTGHSLRFMCRAAGSPTHARFLAAPAPRCGCLKLGCSPNTTLETTWLRSTSSPPAPRRYTVHLCELFSVAFLPM